MFGVGWTEMLIIGVVALVVIGPKDLPIMMQRLGRFASQVRRMGTDFQRELNKTTGLDQLTELKRSITEPLRQTSEEIAREFNQMTADGVRPSGAIKPADPGVESVYSTIASAAGVTENGATGEEGAQAGDSAKPKSTRKPRSRKAAAKAPSGGDVAGAVASAGTEDAPRRKRIPRRTPTAKAPATEKAPAPAGRAPRGAKSSRATGKSASANGATHDVSGASNGAGSEPIVASTGKRRRASVRSSGTSEVEGVGAEQAGPLAPAEDKA